jgi:hypothetical protein
VYDEHFGTIEDTFLKDEKNVEIINCGNESFSFISTLDIVQSKKFNDDKIIYFLEDDYLHRPNWVQISLEGIKEADYVSLCDHAVNYNEEKYTEIFYTRSTHWKKIAGCTNSFLVKYKTLKEDLQYHIDYSKKYFYGYEDLSNNLYKKAINNTMEKPYHSYLYSDDYKKFNEISNFRKIISTIPGYSCHCESRDIVFRGIWESYLDYKKPIINYS